MQYGRRLLILVLALTLVAPVSRAQTPASPESSQSVARLQSFGAMVAFLNLAAGTVRLVAVVEPASPSCASTLAAVGSILESNPSKRLRAYVVWTHLSDQDTEMRALAMANQTRDRRLVHLWDGNAAVASAFRGVLGSGPVPATGVILLYDTDARLSVTPPAPTLWMSNNPAINGPAFDPAQLGANANTMVRRVEAKVTDGTAAKP